MKKHTDTPEENMIEKLAMEGTYGAKPFIRSTLNSSECMLLVIIALLPCAGFAVYSYGLKAAELIGVSVGASFVFELIAGLIFLRRLTVRDYSAIVTGIIIALLLPVNVPLHYPVIAAGAGIIGAKMLFGGIGHNFLNPAAFGRVVLTVLYYPVMTDYASNMYGKDTPLALLARGEELDLKRMILGTVPGMIGTTSVIAILAGAFFLLALGLIGGIMPFFYILGFSVCYVLFGAHGLSYYFLAANLAGGGLLFAAFFMSGDYSTRPLTRKGRVIYGLLLGALTFLYRYLGFIEEAAVFAVLTGNLFSRLIDWKTMPKPFGTRQIQRKIRVKTDRQNRRGLNSAEEEEVDRKQSEADFEEFMRSVMPAGAAKGSETAGTIKPSSVEAHQNRREVIPGRRRRPEPPPVMPEETKTAAQEPEEQPVTAEQQEVDMLWREVIQESEDAEATEEYRDVKEQPLMDVRFTQEPHEEPWKEPSQRPQENSFPQVQPFFQNEELPQPQTRYTSEYAQYIARQEQRRREEEVRRRIYQEQLRQEEEMQRKTAEEQAGQEENPVTAGAEDEDNT